MFYCNKCGTEKNWPTEITAKSFGNYEICGEQSLCNDVPSKLLPIPKTKEE